MCFFVCVYNILTGGGAEEYNSFDKRVSENDGNHNINQLRHTKKRCLLYCVRSLGVRAHSAA